MPETRTSQDGEELQEMRCRCCGAFMGWRRRIGRFVFWCSEDCSDTPMSKWDENQIRDEVIVEMFLGGMGIMEISRDLNDWPYQYVQQTLARRCLQEFMERYNLKSGQVVVNEHIRRKADGTEVTIPRRVLARQAS
jgi:hypothetical protein